jgi:hypothetical protein
MLPLGWFAVILLREQAAKRNGTYVPPAPSTPAHAAPDAGWLARLLDPPASRKE